MSEFPHIQLQGFRTSEGYTPITQGGDNKNAPPRPERKSHGQKLLDDLDRAEKIAKARLRIETVREGLQFIPMRFTEHSYFAMELKRIESSRSRVRIVSVRESKGVNEYLVAVPDSHVKEFATKFREYRDNDTKHGKPRNEPLASGIVAIHAAELSDYWTMPDESPPDTDEVFWWEVWLEIPEAEASAKVEAWFRDVATSRSVELSSQRIRFPDRLVILAYARLSDWQAFPGLLQYLAEFRRANLVAGEFTRLNPGGQAKRIDDLLERSRFAGSDAVRICILDTGADRGHPLLQQALTDSDLHAWRDEWGRDDHDGHGTQMAGVCLYGPLTRPLYGNDLHELRHRIESVKILPPVGKNAPPDYGPITTGSIALAEASVPHAQRVFCLAVSAPSDDHWRPTLWSASIDQAAAGALDQKQRLIVVAAGNLMQDIGKDYPNGNHLSSVEDPSQSWNCLTVGGHTELTWLEDQGLEGYTPIARPGSLSPTSRTSLCWGDQPWPYKPDVVHEGGNYAIDDRGFVTSAEDLEILTTQSQKQGPALLGTISDTSAATAQVARMAAILQAEYPQFWPETIRGLIVHSAEWTPRMLHEFPHSLRRSRLRVYGMGVPNLERARRSAAGFATMVIQDQLQPFRLEGNDDATHEMHMHDLPLPRSVLEDLGNVQVRMRVTLSYFIEPNPPRRGFVAKYQYASHGLRFSVRRPQETFQQMRSRISRSFWEVAANGRRVPPRDRVKDEREWDLGPERISVRGSIHSDSWTGTAVQLASSEMIAVFPVTGWWRYRRDKSIVEQSARYSLIVSISTADSSVDLYSTIQNEIQTRVSIQTGMPVPIQP